MCCFASRDEMGVTPQRGRAHQARVGGPRALGGESGGEKSKFGLSASELVRVVDKLRDDDRLDVLKLIHFHLGSQITDIRYIKSGLQEIARFYAELRKPPACASPTWTSAAGSASTTTDRARRHGERQLLARRSTRTTSCTRSPSCAASSRSRCRISSASRGARSRRTTRCCCSTSSTSNRSRMSSFPCSPRTTTRSCTRCRTRTSRSPVASAREVYHDATFDKERAQALFNSGVLSLRGARDGGAAVHAPR